MLFLNCIIFKMIEEPNFSYIDDIARGDESFRKAMLDVITSEFPEEQKTYKKTL